MRDLTHGLDVGKLAAARLVNRSKSGAVLTDRHWPDKKTETLTPAAGLAQRHRDFAVTSAESYFHVFNSTVIGRMGEPMRHLLLQ